MAESGEGYAENFYVGADYGFDPNYGAEFSVGMSQEYTPEVSQFGYTTDPRMANQLKAVSDKLSTGAKTIEVTAITPAVFESMPKQHLDEINRLRKLVGVDLTFHGPIIEPSGFTRQGWDETQRVQAERQMHQAVQRAHQVNPDGNVIVTFHSGAVGLDPETRVKDEKTGEIITEFAVINQAEGQVQRIPIKPDYFKGGEKDFYSKENQQEKIKMVIDKQNKEAWFRQLFNVSYHASAGSREIDNVLSGSSKVAGGDKKVAEVLLEGYSDYLKGGEISKSIEKLGKPYKEVFQDTVTGLVHGDAYLRDAYQNLQNMFNQAYEVALKNNNKEDLSKLKKFRAEMQPNLKDIEEVKNLQKFGNEIVRGVNVLRSIDPPKALKPFKDFAVDKSSDTFSNIAFSAYKEFKNTSPILSVENPPAGSAPLHRAEDLRQLVDKSREKLQKRFVDEMGMGESEAKQQAEKLIGVTWDVGHINMLRKFGYSGEDIIKETEKIAKHVKHVHLSDNFGMEHTELPMGMGNVPTKPMLEAIGKYNKQLKKIVETGNWFGPQAFGNQTPVRETLRAFGSPLYSMQMQPNWRNIANSSGGYFAGYGTMLPDRNFQTYGAGFSNLPPELGGDMGGRARMGGAPIE